MRHPALIICSNPRSGSTMLCDLLAATGVAGKPNSYYRRESIPDYAARLGVAAAPGEADFSRAYLAAVRRAGSSANGRFALRLMAENRTELSAILASLFPAARTDAARFAAAFGEPLYLHLSRADKLAEAISLLRAEQTGLWHLGADGTERERTASPSPASYDAARIAAHLAALTAFEQSWVDWFAAQSIAPLRLTYEDLAADPPAELARILTALGEDPALADGISPRTGRLGDAESLAWAARFVAERI